jgi:putative N6-adenine-specific DNA methylase
MMHQSGHTMPLLAKTSSGLEPVLAAELRNLGAVEVVEGNRLVRFTGDNRLVYRANLCCRTAIRILLPLGSFRARSRQELYDGIRRFDWRRFLKADGTFAVDAITSGDAFPNSLFAAQCSKDAIVDQFRDASGVRPDVDLKSPDSRVNVHIRDQQVTVAVDTSGESLSHRGYRTQGAGKAPLAEVLAAGMVLLSGWEAAQPLVDGMCGSGTIAIEAALIARSIAPGLLRSRYAFEHFADFRPQLLRQIRDELTAQVIDCHRPVVYASDIAGKQVALARDNASRAGVDGDIEWAVSAFENARAPAGGGVIVMNPPYGERLKLHDLEDLYRRIGDTLKQHYQGYTAWILTGNSEAAGKIGLRTSRRIRLYNGPAECRLLKFELYSGSRKP